MTSNNSYEAPSRFSSPERVTPEFNQFLDVSLDPFRPWLRKALELTVVPGIMASLGGVSFHMSDAIDPARRYLITPNHRSNLDQFALVQAGRNAKFPICRFAGRNTLPLQWLLKSLGEIPVYKDDSGQTDSFVHTCRHLFENGENVAIFPEGTRITVEKSDQENLRLVQKKIYNGAANIAYKSGVDIVPAGVAGLNEDEAGDRRIHVFFGAPISNSELFTPSRIEYIDSSASQEEFLARRTDIFDQVSREIRNRMQLALDDAYEMRDRLAQEL